MGRSRACVVLVGGLVAALVVSACAQDAGVEAPATTSSADHNGHAPGHKSTPSVVVGTSTTSPAVTGAEPGPSASPSEMVARFLPPALTGTDAEPADDECDSMSGMNMSPDTTFDDRQLPNGTYERVYGGNEQLVEVSAAAFGADADDATTRAASEFVDEVRAQSTASGRDDPAEAAAQGFRPLSTCSDHWVNVANMFDDRVLDPTHPEFLMFEPDSTGHNRFVGTMFVARAVNEHGPQKFGPLAPWHYHDHPMCGIGTVMFVDLDPAACPPGTDLFAHSPEMLHVFQRGSDPFRSSMM